MKSIYTRIAFLLLWIPAFLQGQNNLVIQQGTWTQSGAYVVIKNGNLITNGVFQQSAGTAKFSGSGDGVNPGTDVARILQSRSDDARKPGGCGGTHHNCQLPDSERWTAQSIRLRCHLTNRRCYPANVEQ